MSEVSQKNHLSRKISQFISKLKLVKSKKQTEVMNDVENPIDILKTSTSDTFKSIEEIENELNEQKEDTNTPSKFKLFCYEVERFINFLKDNEELSCYIYKYPQLLQKRINVNVDELQSVLAEVKDSMRNIKKLKCQQKFIKKEISTVKKSIPRIKDIEIRELESVLSHSDKDLHNRWMKAKWKYEAIEELMFDAQEKEVALKTLNTLINRYLEKVKKSNLLFEEQAEENSANKEISESLSNSIFSIESKIALPPPLPPSTLTKPVPLTVNALNRNNSRLSWVQRRFRAERRGNFASVRPITENTENEPFVLSLNLNNNERNNTNSNSNTLETESSRLSSNSIENIFSASSNNQNDNSSNGTRQFEDDVELKTDIQSVLQILLGQRTPPLMITNHNQSEISEQIKKNNNCMN